MPNLPKVVRDRLAGAPAGIANQHPDADLLTAFVEGAVSGRERDQLLSHLAACADCREIAALAAPEGVADSQLVAAAAAPAHKWWKFSMLRWAAVSATAVVVLAVGLRMRSPQEQVRITSDAGDRRVKVTASLETEAGMQAAGDRDKSAREENAPADQKSAAALPNPANRKAATTLLDEFEAKQRATKPRPSSSRTDTGTLARNEVKSTESQPAVASEAGAVQAREATNADQLAASKPVAAVAPAATANGHAASDIEAAKVSVARAKSANAQLALNKEKKDESRSATNMEAASSVRPVQGFAGQASGAGSGISGPTPRPAAPVMSAPTSIPAAKLPPARWTIDVSGKLQRSNDLGKTWQAVPVNDGARLNALAVLESEMWAGGAAGALYHSSDGGNNWTRLRPAVGQFVLDDDVVRISLPDAQHVTVTTASSVWASADGGQTWRKQ
jgi:hypothetical protein